MNKRTITKVKRFKDNPFTKIMKIKTKNKLIGLQTSTMKSYENLLVNAVTGQAESTQLVTYRKVDNAEFVKLFAKNISLTFDLSIAGLKALNVVIFTVQKHAIGKDVVPLGRASLDTFLEEFKLKLSESSFRDGLKNLVKYQIIAPTMTRGNYFINPNFIFNGNRFSITEVVETERTQNELEESQITSSIRA